MAKITKQDVWRVATEIDAGGDKPTVLEVRKRLGAGSFTTITAALREWVKPGAEADENDDLDPMPLSVEEKIDQFGADLYAMIYRHVQEQFDEQRKDYEQRIHALEAERDEAAKLSELAETAIESIQAKLVESSDALVKSMSEAKVWELRANDLILDKERALLDAANARQEAGVLAGRLEVLEAKSPAKPSGKPAPKKKTGAVSVEPTGQNVIADLST